MHFSGNPAKSLKELERRQKVNCFDLLELCFLNYPIERNVLCEMTFSDIKFSSSSSAFLLSSWQRRGGWPGRLRPSRNWQSRKRKLLRLVEADHSKLYVTRLFRGFNHHWLVPNIVLQLLSLDTRPRRVRLV